MQRRSHLFFLPCLWCLTESFSHAPTARDRPGMVLGASANAADSHWRRDICRWCLGPLAGVSFSQCHDHALARCRRLVLASTFAVGTTISGSLANVPTVKQRPNSCGRASCAVASIFASPASVLRRSRGWTPCTPRVARACGGRPHGTVHTVTPLLPTSAYHVPRRSA